MLKCKLEGLVHHCYEHGKIGIDNFQELCDYTDSIWEIIENIGIELNLILFTESRLKSINNKAKQLGYHEVLLILNKENYEY